MFQDTPLIMVEDDAGLLALVETLKDKPVIGVDTEADSFHHYQEKLCLIQVSDLDNDYIIDPLKLSDLSPFGTLLENPEQVKVLHGGDYDVVSLKRDFGFQIRNIFDTMIAAQFLGLPRIGLADLVKRFFGYTIDKQYQRHDWAKRPLLPEHLEYARGDTHFLLALREVLTLRLESRGRLAAHREECGVLETREWSGRGDREADFLRVKKSNTLDEEGKRVLRAVWTYRDGRAREMDRPSFKVLPDPVLLDLAKARPTTEEGLHKLMRPKASMTRKHGAALLEAVKAGLEDTRPVPKAQRKRDAKPTSSDRPREGAPSIDLLLGALKQWRNDTVNREKLAPVVVASNSLLKAIAVHAPRDAAELAAVPGVRSWQVETYGERILAVLGGYEDRKPKKKRRRRRKKPASSKPGTTAAETSPAAPAASASLHDAFEPASDGE